MSVKDAFGLIHINEKDSSQLRDEASVLLEVYVSRLPLTGFRGRKPG